MKPLVPRMRPPGKMPIDMASDGMKGLPAAMPTNPRYNARALRPGGKAKGGRVCKASGGIVRGTGISTKGNGKGRIC